MRDKHMPKDEEVHIPNLDSLRDLLHQNALLIAAAIAYSDTPHALGKGYEQAVADAHRLLDLIAPVPMPTKP
jgi:hypothetical protein